MPEHLEQERLKNPKFPRVEKNRSYLSGNKPKHRRSGGKREEKGFYGEELIKKTMRSHMTISLHVVWKLA